MWVWIKYLLVAFVHKEIVDREVSWNEAWPDVQIPPPLCQTKSVVVLITPLTLWPSNNLDLITGASDVFTQPINFPVSLPPIALTIATFRSILSSPEEESPVAKLTPFRSFLDGFSESVGGSNSDGERDGFARTNCTAVSFDGCKLMPGKSIGRSKRAEMNVSGPKNNPRKTSLVRTIKTDLPALRLVGCLRRWVWNLSAERSFLRESPGTRHGVALCCDRSGVEF